MTHRRLVALLCAVLTCLVTGGPTVSALDSDLRSPLFQRSGRPPPRQYRPPPVPQRPPPPRGFFESLFGGAPPPAAAPARPTRPTYVHRPYYRPLQAEPSPRADYRRLRSQRADEADRARSIRRNASRFDGQARRAARRPAREVVKPKINPSTFIVVFGDSLGQSLAEGLDAAMSDNQDVAVTARTSGEASLARPEPYDLAKAAQEALAGQDKMSIAVIMVGTNDRQPIKDGETVVTPGSERWLQIYSSRVTDLVKTFVDRKIPVIWTGQPPMKDDKLAGEMAALNTLDRGLVERAGGVFVDVWEAFVDPDNRYSAYGPDVSGEKIKLRTNDGIHFTKAGERKLAHFVTVEIRRILDLRAAVAGLPIRPSTLDPADPAELVDRQMTTLPEPPGSVGLTVKPLAGPILPLTEIEVTPGGVLLAAAPKATGDASVLIERVFGEGHAVDPRPGRADDFRWPKQGS
ncbi:SGNH/GDSL hydrolase family protein [Chelatococcus reniformis]|uniref:DUF459 domain-containing protein n=1 Tax=Chelatococcus reniformis TaxID=1494448 RepID=A0A916XDL4_9HYPH|nr:SGNH family hydrolase [Chelatococcus reniformis]GGC63900.1 hypothetical protein GCM10010994_23100 [Chelatococcus reniformis]